MKFTATIAAAAAVTVAIILTGCVPAAFDPAPAPAAPAAPTAAVPELSSGEESLRDWLESQGNPPVVVEAMIKLAWSACDVLDEQGADRGLKLMFDELEKHPSAHAIKGAEAIGAGVPALCPRHDDAIERFLR